MQLLSEQLKPGVDFMINQLPGYVLLKDMNSTFLKGSMKVAKLFGLKNINDVRGLTDHTVNHEVAKYGDLYVHQDERLKCIGKSITGFYAIFYDGMLRPMIFNKSLLQDEVGNNIGIFAQCIEISNQKLANTFNKVLNADSKYFLKNYNTAVNYFINNQYDDFNLSTRESQCLFYILRGKSAAGIAKLLHLSARTVESYIEQLKNKMSCHRKSELIEKAIEKGYIQILPPGIINKLDSIDCT